MANYFDKFPLVIYDINKSANRTPQYDLPVNIFVRLRVLTEKLNEVFHYYEYTIKEGETPEILAENLYGNPEAHWIVMMTNNIVDPLYDWPMGYDAYNKYIVNKYGSAATAATTVHHYEMIQILEDTSINQTITNKFFLSADAYTASTLPTEKGAPTVISINGQNVNVYEYKNIVYCDTYEDDLNESKRQIKLIKPEYYTNIKTEFENIMRLADTTRFVGYRVVV